MLANGYYSHDSLDGRTYVDRIRATGYNALDAGNTSSFDALAQVLRMMKSMTG